MEGTTTQRQSYAVPPQQVPQEASPLAKTVPVPKDATAAFDGVSTSAATYVQHASPAQTAATTRYAWTGNPHKMDGATTYRSTIGQSALGPRQTTDKAPQGGPCPFPGMHVAGGQPALGESTYKGAFTAGKLQAPDAAGSAAVAGAQYARPQCPHRLAGPSTYKADYATGLPTDGVLRCGNAWTELQPHPGAGVGG